MGWNAPDDSALVENRKLMQQQLETTKSELEAKRKSLYDTRLSIEKGMTGPQWYPEGQNPPAPKGM